MAQIQDFSGMQYSRESIGVGKEYYTLFNEQYATSSYQIDHDMNPGLIVQPNRDEDIVRVIKAATKQNAAIAVKSGGHQYSGASSTSDKSAGGKPSIQIDLTDTYKERMIFDSPDIPDDKALVYVGVSLQLQEFNDYLKRHKLFVPHGQCAYVCVGGHGQTGGYGQLGRSFGLFGDHITTIHMICHDGLKRDISRQWDSDLFYAILGGSPGNFGIITHYTIEAYKAKSYMLTTPGKTDSGDIVKGPYGFKGLWMYDKKVLTELLKVIARMGDDPTVPRGFDLCVSVLSSDFPLSKLFPQLAHGGPLQKFLENVKKWLDQKAQDLLGGDFPAVIVVYAQWCPTSKEDKFDDSVKKRMNEIRDLGGFFDRNFLTQEFTDLDMAELTGQWIFPKRREFDLPYVKRTYATSSRTLEKDGWPEKVAERLDLIYNAERAAGKPEESKDFQVYQHCKLSVQIQCFGGDQSRFFTNRKNGTSYSWRDSTVVQTLDCFHTMDEDKSKPIFRKYAEDWQAGNDLAFNGKEGQPGCFSKQDKRLLWGSYGEWDLGKEDVWKCYYESKEKYEKIGRERGRADPKGVFTANPFAVKAIEAPPKEQL